MLDTTSIATEIARLITAGTTEHQLLVTVARKFPELTTTELSQPLHSTRRPRRSEQAVKRHWRSRSSG